MTPKVSEPEYARRILAFVRTHAPDRWQGLPVNFGRTFFDVDTPEAQTIDDADLLGLISLEVWGAPISHPQRDPNNRDFVYQRFQRGIMHFDASTGLTRGVLLGDYFKQMLLADRNLPPDLREQARNNPYFKQYCPTLRDRVCRPEALPATDLTYAFTTVSPHEPRFEAIVPNVQRRMEYGFQGDLFGQEERRLAILLTRNAGFGWLKQQVVWSDLEVAPGVYHPGYLARLDALVEDVNAAGLKLMFSLAHAPSFYAAPGTFVPRDPARIGTILRFLSSRYRGRVHAYQTWNEPNLAREWGVGQLWPNGPRELVELQKHAFVGVRGGDANAAVVFPPLAPTGAGACDGCDRRWGVDDVIFLDAVYRVNDGEVRRYFDALGVHPFGHNNPPTDWIDMQTVPGSNFKQHPSFYFKRFTQLRQVMLDHGDDKPIWFTELGWSSCTRPVAGYEYCLDNSEAGQARYLAEAFLLLREAYPYVTHAFVWNLNFPQVVDETDEKWGFGVLRPDGTPRPAYSALARMPK